MTRTHTHGTHRGGAVLPFLGDRDADARVGTDGLAYGVRLHTHLAETKDEEEFACRPWASVLWSTQKH